MPATEMQEIEMEMVKSMYEDHYQVLSLDPFPVYTVLLAIDASDRPELCITVSYPNEDYPSSAACTAVAESVSKHRRVQVTAINSTVAVTLEENIGMHTVVMALQQFQEFLINFAEEEEKAERNRRGEQMKEDEEKQNETVRDPTIRLGVGVTRELFAKWSADRAAERSKALAKEEKAVKAVSITAKLTGRQLWDNSVASAAWELFSENDDGEAVDIDMYDIGNTEEDEEEDYDLS